MKSTQVFTKRKMDQKIMQFALLTLLILGVGGYFGYMHYTEYQSAQTALGAENEKLTELRSSADKAKQDYLALKKELDTENLTVNQSIEKILPANEDFTNLARALDKYFLDTRGTAHPMFLSNLSFSETDKQDPSELAKLPFSMSISGDEDGLKAFLKNVEKSGDINEETRLLDIVSISLGFIKPTEQAGAETSTETGTTTAVYNPDVKNINSSLTLNAFYQKPVTTAKQ